MNSTARFFFVFLLMSTCFLSACLQKNPLQKTEKSSDTQSTESSNTKSQVPNKTQVAIENKPESSEKNPAQEQSAPKANLPTGVEQATNSALPFSPPSSGFSLHKLGQGDGPTLLVVGGIQGDEPGGFSAAALLTTHYKIHSGAVWVVPDLNFSSILSRSRGSAGDMNRKFASIKKDDPDYATVTGIKEVLVHEQVDIVLNLHDGSGFYRPAYESPLHNPDRWGQCVIIDQKEVAGAKFSNLYQLAEIASAAANKSLVVPEHRYHVHNTKTSLGNKEMEKTLSYFVVQHNKAAFGVEASKQFTTEYRTYYHLLVLESFMNQMGIKFTRNFELTPQGVLAALNSNLLVAAFENKLVLPLDNARPNLNHVPFEKSLALGTKASRPLLTIVQENNKWRVAYGNRTLTRLEPLLLDFDHSLKTVPLTIDGQSYNASIGEIVYAKSWFEVDTPKEYRVNVIGTLKEVDNNEARVRINVEDFIPSFSVDKQGQIYRVEIYKDEAFSGMILVHFGTPPKLAQEPLTATSGAESNLGF